MKTSNTTDLFLDEVAKQADINRDRISISPTFYNRHTAEFLRTLVLDGEITRFKYSPEVTSDFDDTLENLQDDIMDKMVEWLRENKRASLK